MSSEFNANEFIKKNKKTIICITIFIIIFVVSISMIVIELSEYKSYKIINVEKEKPSDCPKYITKYDKRKRKDVTRKKYYNTKYELTIIDDDDKERIIKTGYRCDIENYYKKDDNISLNEDYEFHSIDTELIIYSILAFFSFFGVIIGIGVFLE